MTSILDKCAGVPRREFGAGTVLLSEGETSGRLYILADGSVEVLRGDTQVAVIGEPGSVFGELSVLLNRPHTATVRATSPVGVFVFADAESFLKSNPDIAFLLGKLLAERLNAATTYLVDLKRQSGVERCQRGYFNEPPARERIDELMTFYGDGGAA